MEQYSEIDVPEFMQKKSKRIITQEEQEREIKKSFILGGISATLVIFALIIMFTILALIEMI